MQLSAFVDGELSANESELLIRRLSQSPEMRGQVAEYLAIGRALRGETNAAGMQAMRDRIATALDHVGDATDGASAVPTGGGTRKYLRPLAGAAVAAGVALVAIVGLQGPGGSGVQAPAATVATGVVDEGYTVPPVDGVLQRYREMHSVSTSDNINARLVEFEARRGQIPDGSEGTGADGDDAADGDRDAETN